MAVDTAGIVQAYRSTPRYADKGSVLFRPDETSTWQEARRFSTSFVRGEHFRLQVRLLECGAEDDDAALVIIDAPGPTIANATLRVLRQKEKRVPLPVALATASGVTSSVSWLVPSLLLDLPEGVMWFRGLLQGSTAEGAMPQTSESCVALIDSDTSFLRSLEVAMPTPDDPGFRQRITFHETHAR